MDISQAVDRLNSQLPLAQRQRDLPDELLQVHRAILQGLVGQGRVPTADALGKLLQSVDLPAALERLGGDNLVVVDPAQGRALGAYPLTEEDTPHRVSVGGHTVHAMCALDAVSVAPMFGVRTMVHSSCHVTGFPIVISQEHDRIIEADPAGLRIGVRWQQPDACAAHSMCMEMVFLKDLPTALQWQGGDTQHISLFDLAEGVEFGARFFRPLL